MNEEELELYVKKSCENILKQLAENPKEMLDLLELQDKYNNLLKEKIELKRQIKEKNEVIKKVTNAIKNDIDGFITINNYGECNDILELLELYLDILKGDSND